MSADPRLGDGRCQALVVLLALLLDVGWCLERPDLSLPGLLVGLPLQFFVAASLTPAGSFHALQEWALLGWMVSCAAWIFSEFMWDEGHPVGFLKRVPMLVGMDDHLVEGLTVSAVILWCSFFALFGAKVRSRLAADANGIFKLDAEDFEDWWFTLWMLFDASWAVCDIFFVWGWRATAFSFMGYAAGAASLLLIAGCVRRHVALGDCTSAATSVGEFMWVAGNMVWFIDDVITRNESKHGVEIAASLMCIGMASCLASVLGFCRRGPSEQPLLLEGKASTGRVELNWVCPPA